MVMMSQGKQIIMLIYELELYFSYVFKRLQLLETTNDIFFPFYALRLTFWLSNTVVLREVISQAFGGSCNSSPATKFAKSHGNGKGNEMKSTALKWKGSPGSKQINGFMQFVDDWQETGTFTAALEKVESWIFSRIVESVWWQVNLLKL